VVGLVFLPITAFIIINVSKSLKKTSLLSQNKIGDLMSIIEESITNLKIIKVFNGYKFISRNFTVNNERLKQINNRVLWRKDLASPMSEMLSTLVMVTVIWFGGKIVLTSSLEPDSFIGFLVIFSQILPPAKSLTTAFYSIQKGSAAAERVLTILESENEIKKTVPIIQRFQDDILFKNVSFKYENDINLKNINLKINKGDKIAIVGESGSGKSTLIELLLRLHSVSSGEILIDKKNINTNNFRLLFALVTQDVMLFNDTILNNLLLGNSVATKNEIKHATQAANIDEIIKNFEHGYNTLIGAQGNNLSGGERQRIGIARALLSNAPILIFDEPTSSLDSESDNYIKTTLANLDKTKTIITITHKFNAIEEYDNIFVMKKGEIVEQGTHQFLLNKCGVYKKLYEIQTLKSDEKN
jgi:subfamily B ATP-binding cassette protein MsbA